MHKNSLHATDGQLTLLCSCGWRAIFTTDDADMFTVTVQVLSDSWFTHKSQVAR